MTKYKVIYDRESCIGAFACSAVLPEAWKYNEDGKADLKEATYNKTTKRWELIITQQEYDYHLAAAESCPVQVIKIEKIE